MPWGPTEFNPECADFYGLNVTTPFQISITIGDLNDSLKNL